MEISEAIERLRTLHRAVLWTARKSGSPQLSPVVVALDDEERLVISSRETAMKVHNMRRSPMVALCVMNDAFFGEWLQVEGRAEIVSLPDAMEGLVSYYRTISGDHPDWNAYRSAMAKEQRVLIRVHIERAGPDRVG